MKRALIAVIVIVAAGGAFLGFLVSDRPSLEPWRERLLPPAGEDAPGLRVTFLGVSTLLFDDGESAILTDGFFTRPGLFRVLFGRLEPDRERIARALERAGIGGLEAVIAVHSHYDHVMDAAEVAWRTGALLIGSESTANVGRGWGIDEERIHIVSGAEMLELGRFTVTIIPSRHFPHGMAMGDIERPLRPPARATEYREGGSFSVLVEHEGKRLLVQGSAGFVEGALRNRHADVVFLGVAGLGSKDEAYREAYWREIVGAVHPRRVVPIHWDDFTRPLDEPLVPMPRFVDDLDATSAFLLERARQDGIDVKLAPVWTPVDAFAGL